MEEINKNETTDSTMNEEQLEGNSDLENNEYSDQIAELEAENAQLKDALVRTQADMENLRKRTKKEKEEALKYANTNFARDIVSICDNFQRALDAINGQEIPSNMQAFVDGITLTEKEFMSVLGKNDIKKFDSLGERLNPDFHQVLFEVNGDDEGIPDDVKHGHVAKVVQEGYTIKDRLLRPAMVGVLKKQDDK